MKILVIDDETALAELLAQRLENGGHKTQTAFRGGDALGMLESFRPEAVLCDHFLPDISGIELIKKIQAAQAGVPVVMMTGAGSSKLAVQAMKAGAEDYLEKPVDFEELTLLLARIEERNTMKEELEGMKSSRREEAMHDLDILAGASMREVYDEIERVAGMDRVTVLIGGETGTGKEHVARLLHRLSRRAPKPFVEFNCAAFPDHLVESELFGYEAGAFTDAKKMKKGLLESAQGGTVFFDEVGELPALIQAKLLKVLEDREARRVGALTPTPLDIRIVAASNRDLAKESAEGRFRADLFYRLNVYPLTLPPLRERKGDARRLAAFFHERACVEFGRKMEPLSEAALEMIQNHPWPGNVRELRNVVDGLVIRSRASKADLGELRRLLGSSGVPEVAASEGDEEGQAREALPDPRSPGFSGMREVLDQSARALKRRLILKALQQTQGSRTEAARLLQVDNKTLYNLMRELEIAPKIAFGAGAPEE